MKFNVGLPLNFVDTFHMWLKPGNHDGHCTYMLKHTGVCADLKSISNIYRSKTFENE
jgi:hypothetical protein